jgi:hypothetical protein
VAEVLTGGRAALGGGRYETLVCPGLLGLLDGCPLLAFTASWPASSVTPTRPSAYSRPVRRRCSLGQVGPLFLLRSHTWITCSMMFGFT